MFKKYLMLFLLILSFASYSNTYKSLNKNYMISKYISSKTNKIEKITLSNLNNVLIKFDSNLKSGNIIFRLIDKNNKEIFSVNNPKKLKKEFNLILEETYTLSIELKNFIGEYKFDLNSNYKSNEQN